MPNITSPSHPEWSPSFGATTRPWAQVIDATADTWANPADPRPAQVNIHGHIKTIPSKNMAKALRMWAWAVREQVAGARKTGARFLVLVNIGSYMAHVIDLDTGRQVMESAVIVGMNGRRTPRFWTPIVNLKVSPDWNPPTSIEKHPVRVPPGPDNPLGLVRFSTKNHVSIYLHATNHPHLFKRRTRALSHGCIRVQNWPGLAQVLGQVSAATFTDWMDDRHTEYHPLPQKVWARVVDSAVDIVASGKQDASFSVVVSDDPYHQGNKEIGRPSLNGLPESDPVLRYAASPDAPPGTADWKRQ